MIIANVSCSVPRRNFQKMLKSANSKKTANYILKRKHRVTDSNEKPAARDAQQLVVDSRTAAFCTWLAARPYKK